MGCNMLNQFMSNYNPAHDRLSPYQCRFSNKLKLLLLLGAIKKFSAWPSSVQNKFKREYASYSSKAQNTTCTIWLLGYKYFVHFNGHRLFAFDMEKTELRSVIKWQFWPIRSFHCMLCCSDSESKLWIQVSSWITICDINFCWVLSAFFEKFFNNLCTVLVLASQHPSDRHCVHMLKCTKYL